MKRKRLFVTITVVVLVGSACVSAPLWVDALMNYARSGPTHTFSLPHDIDFLTEEVALKKSRETLALDGFDVSHWEPIEDGRSTAPDGVADKYLNRNTLNPNRLSVLFIDHQRRESRVVILELQGNQLTTFVWLPK